MEQVIQNILNAGIGNIELRPTVVDPSIVYVTLKEMYWENEQSYQSAKETVAFHPFHPLFLLYTSFYPHRISLEVFLTAWLCKIGSPNVYICNRDGEECDFPLIYPKQKQVNFYLKTKGIKEFMCIFDIGEEIKVPLQSHEIALKTKEQVYRVIQRENSKTSLVRYICGYKKDIVWDALDMKIHVNMVSILVV